MEELTDALATWRDDHVRQEKLRRVVDRHKLERLVLIYEQPPKRVLRAAPMRYTFEPLPLDEGHKTITEFVEAALHHSRPSTPDVPCVRPASVVKRFLTRYGLMAAIIPILANLPGLLNIMRTSPRLGATLIATMLALLLVITLIRRQQEWFIVPGAVIVRRRGATPWTTRLDRYTPAEKVLSLASAPKGQLEYWVAIIGPGKGAIQRNLTTIEAEALLAAWTSPVPPPDMKKLSELR